MRYFPLTSTRVCSRPRPFAATRPRRRRGVWQLTAPVTVRPGGPGGRAGDDLRPHDGTAGSSRPGISSWRGMKAHGDGVVPYDLNGAVQRLRVQAARAGRARGQADRLQGRRHAGLPRRFGDHEDLLQPATASVALPMYARHRRACHRVRPRTGDRHRPVATVPPDRATRVLVRGQPTARPGPTGVRRQGILPIGGRRPVDATLNDRGAGRQPPGQARRRRLGERRSSPPSVPTAH